jgi:hypothetical protein
MSGLTSIIHDTSVKLDKEIDKILSSSLGSRAPPKVHLTKTVKYFSPAKKTNSIKAHSPSKSMDKSWKKEPSDYQKKILEKYNTLSEAERRIVEEESVTELKPIKI